MQPGDIPKQRGIYSEILTTEDTDNLKVTFTSLNQLIAARFNHWSIVK